MNISKRKRSYLSGTGTIERNDHMVRIRMVKEEIIKMTKPVLGSFGEFIFYKYFEEKEGDSINPVHRNRIDFLLNDIPYDVKTTGRLIESNISDFRPFTKGYEGVRIVYVVFHLNGCTITDLELHEEILDWDLVEEYFIEWKKFKGYSYRVFINDESNEISMIKERIRDHFRKKGYRARIICRTNQHDFGNESPHNLVPGTIRDGNITIFILIKDHRKVEDNIRMVYAIPDNEMKALPMIEKERLHEMKVNLDKLDDRYGFDSIKDLFE